MNKHLFSLACLALLAMALPSCRNRKHEAKMDEEINTMIELDNLVIEEEVETADKKVIKF